MYTCKKCNTKIEDEWKLCPKCGTPVQNADQSKPYEDSFDKTVKRASEVYGAIRLDNIPPGYIIDERYEVQRKLGQGGFGAVYLAYDRKMEVEKALKVIPEVVASDRESMKQLHREAKIMIKLNHPNIVRVYDFNDSGEVKYIDMEYVDGKTLTDLKLEHPDEKLPEAEVIKYSVKIAEAFEYAHRKDILHRDIKPQNVMVTSEGDIKVMDFGIAETVRSSMTRLTGVSSSGTLAYMSPEQLRGKEIGKESDVYSFGAMLYDLLSGHPPFYRGDIQYQILNESPEKLKGISECVNDLLLKCLQKKYQGRPENFSALINLLNRKKEKLQSEDSNSDAKREFAQREIKSEAYTISSGSDYTNIVIQKKTQKKNKIVLLLGIIVVFVAIVMWLINNQDYEISESVPRVHKTPAGVSDSIVVIKSTMGVIKIELFEEDSPLHSQNFMKLAKEGFYNGTTFHRVIPGFVVQGGDPNSRSHDRTLHGRGGPGYTIPAEIGIDHKIGYVAAARLGDQVNPRRESSGSQFYICLADLPSLDGQYTVFGRVFEGMDVVNSIAAVNTDRNDNPINRIEMVRVYVEDRYALD